MYQRSRLWTVDNRIADNPVLQLYRFNDITFLFLNCLVNLLVFDKKPENKLGHNFDVLTARTLGESWCMHSIKAFLKFRSGLVSFISKLHCSIEHKLWRGEVSELITICSVACLLRKWFMTTLTWGQNFTITCFGNFVIVGFRNLFSLFSPAGPFTGPDGNQDLRTCKTRMWFDFKLRI